MEPSAWRGSGTVMLLLALVSGSTATADRDGWQTVRQPAQPFEVKDLTGQILRSDRLRGKVVVVDFWATWCAPCIQELPDLAAYHRRLAGRKDVVLLSFNATDERDTLIAFVERKKIPFPVYRADAVAEAYEIGGFPTKLVIDMRNGPGVVRFRREGQTPIESLQARVEELLAGSD